ncbi:MAG TPA: amylo-alpha-1,6-glucosidase, partial [Capsulimonadaceae bacterium]|nr:amylo-alpha-1,6-glucosidase [Capsulimonadaceae bacterium]
MNSPSTKASKSQPQAGAYSSSETLNFPKEVLQNWDKSSRHEWLVTNGIGGYASSSLSGANTRRYHGLLVAACQPPLGRAVLLSKLEEEIRIEDQLYFLSANRFPSVIYPQGYQHLVAFRADPVPTFTYQLHERTVLLQKQIWMPRGKNTVYVRYSLINAPEPIRFGLQPFMAYKDYHAEQHRWDGFWGKTHTGADCVVNFQAYDNALPVRMSVTPCQAFVFEPHGGWFFNYEHEREAERGLDFTEDLFSPGKYEGILAPGKSIAFAATIEPEPPADAEASLSTEAEYQDKLLTEALVGPKTDPALRRLVIAADQFVIESSPRVSRATIIAGYPWFSDWGRDTMIALPGLCLSTGRHETARQILRSFAEAVRDGLIPNRFTDNGEGAEFNTVDATLWFFQAAYLYGNAFGDWPFLLYDLLPVFEKILDAHTAGTCYNIHADPADGLLYAGQPGVQLTWMDAKVGDWVVTPRIGKPVEIQALWYNALCITADLMRRAEHDPAQYEKLAERAKKSFKAKFASSDNGCLYDVIDTPPDGAPDSSIRPNQILALSLSFPVLAPGSDLAKRIVDVVGEKLYTPFGLRTLAPGSPSYRAHYGPGDQT